MGHRTGNFLGLEEEEKVWRLGNNITGRLTPAHSATTVDETVRFTIRARKDVCMPANTHYHGYRDAW